MRRSSRKLDAESLNKQFIQDAGELFFAHEPSVYWSGLEALVGMPDASTLLDAMEAEHCAREDADALFTAATTAPPPPHASNGSSSPARRPALLDEFLIGLGLPTRMARGETTRSSGHGRSTMRFTDFKHSSPDGSSTQSSSGSGAAALGGRVAALRLYTSIFSTIILRVGTDFFVGAGLRIAYNRYEATLHVLSAAITKLGKLTQVPVVYRGHAHCPSFGSTRAMGWPASSRRPPSTSSDKEVALQYARRSKAKLLFELRLGLWRGADIGRFGLSQYLAEAEIPMPRTALQAVEPVIEKDLAVVFRLTLRRHQGACGGGRWARFARAREEVAACEQAGGGGGGAGGGGPGGGGGRRAQGRPTTRRQWKPDGGIVFEGSSWRPLARGRNRQRVEVRGCRQAEPHRRLDYPTPNAEREPERQDAAQRDSMQELKEQLKQAEAVAEEAVTRGAYAAGTRHGGGARCEGESDAQVDAHRSEGGRAGGAAAGGSPARRDPKMVEREPAEVEKAWRPSLTPDGGRRKGGWRRRRESAAVSVSPRQQTRPKRRGSSRAARCFGRPSRACLQARAAPMPVPRLPRYRRVARSVPTARS